MAAPTDKKIYPAPRAKPGGGRPKDSRKVVVVAAAIILLATVILLAESRGLAALSPQTVNGRNGAAATAGSGDNGDGPTASSLDCVHVLYGLSGNSSTFLDEFDISLKSVLLNSPIDLDLTVHIMADGEAYAALPAVLLDGRHNFTTAWRTRNRIDIRVYDIEPLIPTMRDVIGRAMHQFSVDDVTEVHTIGTFFRLFADRVVGPSLSSSSREVTHVIYMDTDVVIMSDLGELWSHVTHDAAFQWGGSMNAGFVILNLQKLPLVWNVASTLDLMEISERTDQGANDQLVFQAVNRTRPDLVQLLPKEWDVSVTSLWRGGLVADRDYFPFENMSPHRPDGVGMLHFNGGKSSKENVFTSGGSFLDIQKRGRYGWANANYYVRLPWAWARYLVESRRRRGEEGHRVGVEFITNLTALPSNNTLYSLTEILASENTDWIKPVEDFKTDADRQGLRKAVPYDGAKDANEPKNDSHHNIDDTGTFMVGQRVKGNWQMRGIYYNGVVTAISGKDITIQYDDDGTFETLPVSAVRALRSDGPTYEPTRHAGARDQNEDFGYKANVRIVAHHHNETTMTNNNRCPLVFGLGHQKSGTTTIVMALGSIANVTAKSDIWQLWSEEKKTDDQVLRAIHPKNGNIQKEGHGLYYLEQMIRLCPQMRFYLVRRDILETVRSMADRLGITGDTTCDNDLKGMEDLTNGMRNILSRSNDTSCLIRLAASVMHYYRQVEKLLSHGVTEIRYEEYLNDTESTIQKLCRSLEVLGSCNNTHSIDKMQYQEKGKNRGRDIEELWPKDILAKLRNMVAESKQGT